jgi:hypothetical protein
MISISLYYIDFGIARRRKGKEKDTPCPCLLRRCILYASLHMHAPLFLADIGRVFVTCFIVTRYLHMSSIDIGVGYRCWKSPSRILRA